MDWTNCKIKPHKNFKLSECETNAHKKHTDKEELKKLMQDDIDEIEKYQNKLFAESRQSLLIILQGMDSAGKDGTIKHIMRAINPQGSNVVSFKHPSGIELEHNYLWRHAIKLPEHGLVTIFNRSHYENVLISKVHPEIVLAERLPGIKSIDKITKEFWNKRYKQINYFEKNNVSNGTHILKFFLHISKEEQARRFIERIEHKEKHWKFSSSDINERKFWNEYQDAYEQTLKHTSTKVAPWYLIPADDKPSAHYLVNKIILEKLKSMNPVFPLVSKSENEFMQEAKKKLLQENQ